VAAGWRTGFLGRLGDRERQALLASGAERFYPAGRPVFGEGRSADTLVVLLDGRVKVTTSTTEGNEHLLALRGPGDLLGELSTLVGEERTSTVIAIDDVRLLVVPIVAFEALLAAHPPMSSTLIRMLVERVLEADRNRMELALPADDRLARLLVRLADRFGRVGDGGTVRIDLRLSQDELAALVSTSRGAVSMALRGLREAGLVRTARREIVLLDLDRLRDRLS
jgi:CRP/FNR family transcriptional regulator, cyclic AMP receptor protein